MNNTFLSTLLGFSRVRLLTLSFLACFLISACTTNAERAEQNWSEKKLYRQAKDQLENNNYYRAVDLLQMLESRYPFGPYAEQAQLDLIYGHFKSYEYEAAVASAERFIRLHPQHPSIDYAYYMKGLSNYTEGRGIFDRFIPSDASLRDPGPAREAFFDFAQLLARYPNSAYAADAKARMVYLRNLLARAEINSANYYFKRGAYLAAANRGKRVVENYPNTPAVADALAVMTQAYILLDLAELSDESFDVLKLNYPQHPSVGEDGKFVTKFHADGIERSWLNRLSFGILDHPEPPTFDYRPEYGY